MPTQTDSGIWVDDDGQVIGFYLPGAIHISRGTEVERQDEAADTWDVEAYCGRVVSSANAYEAATAIETAIKHATVEPICEECLLVWLEWTVIDNPDSVINNPGQ